ncbi:MAG: hypothetical protein RIT81_12590 [Deltaproteobacteria bacterium]
MKRLALALLLSTAACKSSTASSMEALQESVDAYNHAYRWKNYERAASFLPNDMRAAFIAAYEDDQKSLHIEAYRILQVDVEGEEAATVQVRMSYTLLPDITVQKRTLTQHWHKVGGAWILETEDDSLREIAMGASPKNPAASGELTPPASENTEVEVTSPGDDIPEDESDPE